MKERLDYSTTDICAVIVAFNPDEKLMDNVMSLQSQVEKIIIVDNGSNRTDYLKRAAQTENLDCIKLGNNTGIAFALNEGLQYCIDNGYSLILTMDQDTVLDLDAVIKLLRKMNDIGAESVGINWDDSITEDKKVSYLITSGNLVNVAAAKKIGGFDEKLFIDSVDFDFSLRLIDAGCKLIKVADAKAHHNLGEVQGGSGYTTHSVNRYFYIYRNHFYLCKKFWKKHPVFVIKKNIALALDLWKILIQDREKKEKFEQLRNGWKAYKDMIQTSYRSSNTL